MHTVLHNTHLYIKQFTSYTYLSELIQVVSLRLLPMEKLNVFTRCMATSHMVLPNMYHMKIVSTCKYGWACILCIDSTAKNNFPPRINLFWEFQPIHENLLHFIAQTNGNLLDSAFHPLCVIHIFGQRIFHMWLQKKTRKIMNRCQNMNIYRARARVREIGGERMKTKQTRQISPIFLFLEIEYKYVLHVQKKILFTLVYIWTLKNFDFLRSILAMA